MAHNSSLGLYMSRRKSVEIFFAFLLFLALASHVNSMTTLPSPSITVYLSALPTATTNATGWESGTCTLAAPCSPSAQTAWSVPASTICQFIIPYGSYSSTLRVALKEDSQVIISGATPTASITSLSINLEASGNIDPLVTTRRAYLDQMTYSATAATILSSSSLTSVEIRNSSISGFNFFTMENLISLQLIGSTVSVSGAVPAISYQLPSNVATGNVSIIDTKFTCSAASSTGCAAALALKGQISLSGPNAGRSPSIIVALTNAPLGAGFTQFSTLASTNASSSPPLVDYSIGGATAFQLTTSSTNPIFALPTSESSPPGLFSSLKTSGSFTIAITSGVTPPPALTPKTATANFDLTGFFATNVTIMSYSKYPNTIKIGTSYLKDCLVSLGPASTAQISSTFFYAAGNFDSIVYTSNSITCDSCTFNDLAGVPSIATANLVLLPGSVFTATVSSIVLRLGVCDGASYAGFLKTSNIVAYKVTVYDTDGAPTIVSTSTIDVSLSYLGFVDNSFLTLRDDCRIQRVSLRNVPALQYERTSSNTSKALISTLSLAPFVGPVFPKISVLWGISSFKPSENTLPSVFIESETIAFSHTPVFDASRNTSAYPIHLEFYDQSSKSIAYALGEEEATNATLTCQLPKPLPESLFECSDGLWVTNIRVNVTADVIIYSPIIINANFEAQSVEINGLNSTIDIRGCALLPSEITVILSGDDLRSLKVNGTRYAELIKSACFTQDPSNLTLVIETGSQIKSCERLSGSLTTSGQSITGLFVLNSDGCRASSKTWWIVLAAVLGSVVLLVIILVLIFSLVPSARVLIRPYLARSDYHKEKSGNVS